MSIAAVLASPHHSLGFTKVDFRRSSHQLSSLLNTNLRSNATTAANYSTLSWQGSRKSKRSVLVFSGGGGNGGNGHGSGGGHGGGDDKGKGEGEGEGFDRNNEESILVLAEIGRSLDSLPKDLAAAIESGRIPGSILLKYLELEKSPFFRWLMQFGGFRERLMADDLFFAKLAMECGVGVFTKVLS